MFLSKKNILKIALLSLGIQYAYSMELRPLVQFDFFPNKTTAHEKVNSVKNEKEWDTEFIYIGGAELLFGAKSSPIHYGFGLGYKSAQKDGSALIVPATLPIWGNISFGPYGKDWFAIPYAVVRLGYQAPLTDNGNWWELPLNFFAGGGVGIILPFDIGLEVNYSYSSLLKSFKNQNTEYRVNSGRLGVQLSIGFDLTHEKTNKPEDQVQKTVKEEPRIADTTEESSEPETTTTNSDSSSTYNTEPTESVTEDTASNTVTEESPAEETAAEEAPAAEQPASEESAAEQPATEDSTAEQPATEEAATEESANEPEAVAEPEPEPVAEPAPEPESKPAAKKSSKKTNKKAKKTTKKSTKKTSKKSSKKGKKKK